MTTKSKTEPATEGPSYMGWRVIVATAPLPEIGADITRIAGPACTAYVMTGMKDGHPTWLTDSGEQHGADYPSWSFATLPPGDFAQEVFFRERVRDHFFAVARGEVVR